MTASTPAGRAPALLALTVVLSSCGLAGLGASDPGATRLTTWSESTARSQAERAEWHDPLLRTALVDTAAQREEAIAALPASVPTAEVERVRAVGLDESVLVLAVYNKCDETSSLALDDGVLRLVIEPGGANCAWAPVQVEAWSVPRANLPDPVVLRDQRGDPA